MPCFQSDILDVGFFRLRKQPLQHQRMQLNVWEGPSFLGPLYTSRKQVYSLGNVARPGAIVKTIQLTQGFGATLTVYVSEFLFMEGDKVSYMWTNASGAHVMEMPHYCLTELEKVKVNVMRYVRQTRNEYLYLLKETNDLTWSTIRMAIHFAGSRRVS